MNADNTPEQEPVDRVRFHFRKSHHIRRPAEFQNVYRRKHRAADATLLIFVAPNELPHCRLGLSVSKKSHGHAFRRNRIRRLLREAFRLEQYELPGGFDIVVVPRTQTDLGPALLTQFRRSLVRLTKKAASRI